MRHFHVAAQAKEHISRLPVRIFFAPDTAIAKMRDGADAAVERNALLAMGLKRHAVAGRLRDLDIAQRQIVAIQQFCDFGRRQQRLGLRAAIVHRLGAQALYARLQLVESRQIGARVHAGAPSRLTRSPASSARYAPGARSAGNSSPPMRARCSALT